MDEEIKLPPEMGVEFFHVYAPNNAVKGYTKPFKARNSRTRHAMYVEDAKKELIATIMFDNHNAKERNADSVQFILTLLNARFN